MERASSRGIHPSDKFEEILRCLMTERLVDNIDHAVQSADHVKSRAETKELQNTGQKDTKTSAATKANIKLCHVYS